MNLRLRPLTIEILISLATFAAACTSIYLTRAPGGIALFWPCNAIAAAMLIRGVEVRWLRMGLLLLLAIFLANILAAHRAVMPAIALGGVNLLEIGLMVLAFRWVWVFPYPYITIAQAAIMTVTFGVVIPGSCALVGGAIVHQTYGTEYWPITLQWWSSHAIGACLLGPPLILLNLRDLRRLSGRAYLPLNLASAAAVLTSSYLAFCYVRFPFVSIALLLLVCAFNLGGVGTSLLSLATGLLITNLWACGVRPLGLASGPGVGTLVDLPVLALLATVMPSIAVGIGSDGRRAMARALRANEHRFRESMANSPVGMLIADFNGTWQYTNLALQRMLGYTEQEFRSLPPGGPSDAADWEDSKARWSSLLSGEINMYRTERRFRHKDGQWIWTHVAVSLLRDEDGKPSDLIAQIESLEARRQAEAVLAAERQRLRITLNAIADAVLTTDAETRIAFVNPAAERLLGIGAAAAVGRRVDEVIHLSDASSTRAAASLLARCVAHGREVRREEPCTLLRADGAVIYVRDSVAPVFDSTGLLTGMVMVLHEASADVQRAQELQRRASRDALTGVASRAEFLQQLRSTFERGRGLETPAALLAIDLDRFKAVNDTGGHAAGDEVLRKVGQTCQIHVRAADTVARLGGDEFAIILPSCNLTRAQTIAAKILAAMNPLQVDWQGSRYSVGASIGIAALRSEMATPEQWLAAADAACYRAKREGRGVLRVDEPN